MVWFSVVLHQTYSCYHHMLAVVSIPVLPWTFSVVLPAGWLASWGVPNYRVLFAVLLTQFVCHFVFPTNHALAARLSLDCLAILRLSPWCCPLLRVSAVYFA